MAAVGNPAEARLAARATPVELLAWLVTSGAEPWLPTAVQQDEAFPAMVESSRRGAKVTAGSF